MSKMDELIPTGVCRCGRLAYISAVRGEERVVACPECLIPRDRIGGGGWAIGNGGRHLWGKVLATYRHLAKVKYIWVCPR